MATTRVKYLSGLLASSAIAKYRLLAYAAGNKVAQAVAATTYFVGVSYSAAAKDGDTLDVVSIEASEGPILIECGGAIATGKFAKADADGKAVTADDGFLAAFQPYANGDIGEFYPMRKQN